MAFRLRQPVRVFRIGHPAYPLWNGAGAAACGGRWNPVGSPVVYAASSYSLALLETLANLNSRRVPPHFVRAELVLPAGCLAERLRVEDLASWPSVDMAVTQGLGEAWLRARRSLALFVPSVVVEGLEENVILNPRHPAFTHLEPKHPQPVRWDERLLHAGIAKLTP